MFRYRTHLLFDLLQPFARARSRACLQHHRINGREPTHRPRHIHCSLQFFAPVAFYFHHHALRSTPTAQRLRQGRQQHFLNLRVIDPGHVLQQRSRLVRTQYLSHCPHLLDLIAAASPARHPPQRLLPHVLPVTHLLLQPRTLTVLLQTLRPLLVRTRLRPKLHSLATCQLLVAAL